MSDLMKRIDLRNSSALIVDDNAQALELLNQVLLGFRLKNITTARSSFEAESHTTVTRFDLLIIDTDMPEEDGLSLTRKIRKSATNPNTTAPIIMLGAHTPIDRVMEARNAGANLVVKKPIVPGVLLQRIAWLARTNREYVRAPNYCGPDRRFKLAAPPDGEERRESAKALLVDRERALSQQDIDSLFG